MGGNDSKPKQMASSSINFVSNKGISAGFVSGVGYSIYKGVQGNLFKQAENKNDISSKLSTTENESIMKNIKFQEEIIQFPLIWVDANVNNAENKVYLAEFKKKFVQVFSFTSIIEYQQYIQKQIVQTQQIKYFLLMSGSLGQDLIKIVQYQSFIIYAFVFCFNLEYHKTWVQSYPKIKKVTNNITEVKQFFINYYLRHGYEKLDYQAAYHFTDNEKNRNYIYLSFMIELCVQKGNLEKDTAFEDFQQFSVQYINQYEKNKSIQLTSLQQLIQDFQNNSFSSNAIEWYTKESFFYRLINNTLRKGNFIDIFQIRIAIYELYRQIKIRGQTSSSNPQVLYRGTCINKSELSVWQNTQKIPLMLQGFVSTSKLRNVAEAFARSTYNEILDKNQISKVLLIINTQFQTTDLPVKINQISYYQHEEEYLAQLNTFLIVDKLEVQGDIIVVTTKLSQFQEIYKTLNEIIKNRLESIKKVMKKQFNLPELFLINVLYHTQDYKLMIEVLNKIKNQSIDQSQIFSFFGHAYAGLGQTKEAINYYLKDYSLTKEQYGINHTNTATSLSNIALLYQETGHHDLALKYQLKVLEIDKITLGENDSLTATSYNNVALTYEKLENYQQALKFHNKALSIKLNCLGEKHVSVANTYQNVAQVYVKQGFLDEGLSFSIKALNIIKIAYGEYHQQTSNLLYSISHIYKKQGNLYLANQEMKKCYEISKRNLGENDEETKECLQELQEIQKQMNRI